MSNLVRNRRMVSLVLFIFVVTGCRQIVPLDIHEEIMAPSAESEEPASTEEGESSSEEPMSNSESMNENTDTEELANGSEQEEVESPEEVATTQGGTNQQPMASPGFMGGAPMAAPSGAPTAGTSNASGSDTGEPTVSEQPLDDGVPTIASGAETPSTAGAGTGASIDEDPAMSDSSSNEPSDSGADTSNGTPDSNSAEESPAYQSGAFVSVWSVSANETLVLPISRGGIPGLVVDWGDGTAPYTYKNASVGTVEHTYAEAGEYTISISGRFSFDKWSFMDYPYSKDRVLKILQWGMEELKHPSGAFYEATNLLSFPSNEEVQLFGNASYMFAGTPNLVGSISNWDVSKATDMDFMFEGSASGQ